MTQSTTLGTSDAKASARSLAVPLTGEHSGCTLSPYPWIPAHVAFQAASMCIVVHHKRVKRAWPFMVQVVSFDGEAQGGAPLAGIPGAMRETPPDGNHGGYKKLQGVTNV